MLLLPDLLGFWLTGSVGAERTNASTTGLYDVRSRRVGHRARRPGRRPVGDPAAAARPPATGRRHAAAGRGRRRSASTADVPVIAVGSHDTASAVVGRARRRRAVGVHLVGHVVAGRPRARRAGADRGGPAGRLHQRGRRRRHDPVPQERDGPVGALGVVRAWGDAEPGHGRCSRGVAEARAAADRRRHQRPAPAAAGRHAGAASPALAARRRRAGARETPVEVTRCILDSLALAYRRHVRAGGRARRPRASTVVHVVGGGSRNDLLCQLTADACGLPVLAGPAEASALGNVLVQARALGADLPDLAAMRDAGAAYPRGTPVRAARRIWTGRLRSARPDRPERDGVPG